MRLSARLAKRKCHAALGCGDDPERVIGITLTWLSLVGCIGYQSGTGKYIGACS